MKIRNWMPIPALVLFTAGCADSLTSPSPAMDASIVTMSHTYEEGNTVQGYDAPTLSHTVFEDQVEICAVWTDFENFEVDAPDHYSFDFELQGDDGWIDLGSANDKDSTDRGTACFTTDPMDDGDYLFRVKGMALLPVDGTPPTSPQHSLYETVEVTVGETLRFEAYLRSGQTEMEWDEFNANPEHFNLQFFLKLWDADADAFVKVSDCSQIPEATIVVSAEWSSPGTEIRVGVYSDDCDEVGGAISAAVHKMQMENAYRRDDSSGELVFRIDGVANENTVLFDLN